MKKLTIIFKILLLVSAFVIFLMPTLSVNVDAGQARDPHQELGGGLTLCYNLHYQLCGTPPE